MTQVFLTTATGTEKAAILEARELADGTQISTGQGYAIISTTELLQACKFSYQSQSITGSYILLGKSARTQDLFETTKNTIKGTDWRNWINSTNTFVVRCNKDESFSSQELCAETGAFIIEATNAKVDVKKPDVTVYVHATQQEIFLCIDLCGFDLSKRSYRVFSGSDFIKGTTAYGILRIAGYTIEKRLADPFCRSGTIPIEAALHLSRKSPNFYDKEKFIFTRLPQLKGTDWTATFNSWDEREAQNGDIIAMDANLRNIMAAKKNAKIAGVNKFIHFSRTDLTWLDAKFGKHSLDMIVSVPIQPSQRVDEEKIRKIYREFFYQAEFILKNEGKMSLLMQKESEIIEKEAKNYKFKISEKHTIWLGKEKWTIITLLKEQISHQSIPQ